MELAATVLAIGDLQTFGPNAAHVQDHAVSGKGSPTQGALLLRVNWVNFFSVPSLSDLQSIVGLVPVDIHAKAPGQALVGILSIPS